MISNRLRPFLRILLAAIIGAMLSITLLRLLRLAHDLHVAGHVNEYIFQYAELLSYVLIIPLALIQISTGYDGVFLNEYLINALLAGVLFSLIEICRITSK